MSIDQTVSLVTPQGRTVPVGLGEFGGESGAEASVSLELTCAPRPVAVRPVVAPFRSRVEYLPWQWWLLLPPCRETLPQTILELFLKDFALQCLVLFAALYRALAREMKRSASSESSPLMLVRSGNVWPPRGDGFIGTEHARFRRP